MQRCPGQDQRFWKTDDIFELLCPHCDATIEFWKDDPKRKCPRCKTVVPNPRLDLGCAKWCQYAAECLGGMGDDHQGVLCDKLIGLMKKAPGQTTDRIELALKVLSYAARIQAEEGGHPLVVKAVSILLALEDLDRARTILTRCGVDSELIDPICQIITSLQTSEILNQDEFAIVSDAQCLARRAGTSGPWDNSELLTETGRQLANQEFTS